MKKPRKKYRPKPVRMTAPILDAVMGDITDDEIARIYELAEEGLDLLQLGSKDVMAFHKVDAAVRAAFTLAEAFEHKYDIQALCVLATGALIMASTWNENQDQPIKEKLLPAASCPRPVFAAFCCRQRFLGDSYSPTPIREPRPARHDRISFLRPSDLRGAFSA